MKIQRKKENTKEEEKNNAKGKRNKLPRRGK